MSIQTEPDSDEDQEASAGDESTTPSQIAKDDAFHVLQNARRRAVLRYLLERDDTERFVMRDMAEAVAAWEHDTTVQQLTSAERQRVYIALYQSHLPKLEKHGVITYDQPRGIVKPTSLLAVFEPYLDAGLHAADDLLGTDVTDEDDEETRPSLTAAMSTYLSR